MDRKIKKKKWPPKKIAAYSGSGLIIFFILYIFLFSDRSSKLNVELDRITISIVQQDLFQEYIPPTGLVEPIQKYFLDVSEGGRIVEKFVEEGAFLEEGDPIIRLENPSLTLNIMYNEAQVFQTMNSLRGVRLSMEQNSLRLKAQLLNLEYDILKQKRKFRLNKKLHEKKLISEIEFEESHDDYDYLIHLRSLTIETNRKDSLFRLEQIKNLEINVKRMQRQLEMTSAQMENLTVRAPIKGQLTALDAEIGESISRGQNLGRIDNIDSFKVSSAIDEHYIARIRVGQKAEFDFNGTTYKLIINKVFPQVTDGRFDVDLLFSGNAPANIRRGQTVRLKLELGDLTKAVLVDRGGFYQSTGGQWIFVLDKTENFATRRNIKLGRQNPLMFEVLEGLEPGEKVITSSYDNYGEIEKLIIK